MTDKQSMLQTLETICVLAFFSLGAGLWFQEQRLGVQPNDGVAADVFYTDENRIDEAGYIIGALQRVIFHKDASGLVLRLARAAVTGGPGAWLLEADLAGERLDPARHVPGADLKAVTFQGWSVRRTWRGWVARVVLDV